MTISYAIALVAKIYSFLGDDEVVPSIDPAEELSGYIERKLYKSCIGDIVPTITANALNIVIIVIEKRNNGFECYNVGKNANNSNSIPLILLKNGEHYDGLAIIHNQRYERHVIEYVMNGNACTTGRNTVLATDDVSETSNICLRQMTMLITSPRSLIMYTMKTFKVAR